MSDALGTRLSDLLAVPVGQVVSDTGSADNISICSETVEEWFRDGVRLLKQQDYILAAIKMGAVALVTPENLKAKNNLAVALYHLGRTDDALEVLDEILTRDRDNSTAIRNRKRILDEIEE
jgi:thioredoxin-like negative regulator of GroEL